jgi:hypothetical protein
MLWVAGCSGRVDLKAPPLDCGLGDFNDDLQTSTPIDVASDDAEAGGDGSGNEAAAPPPAEASSETAPPDAANEGEAAPATDMDATSPPEGAADAPPAAPDGPPSTCFDLRKDGDESDVDCGGSCAGCGPHKLCYGDFDCSATASGCDTAHGGCFCQYFTHQCVYDHCYDGKVSGDESGVDCGGTACSPCATGLACNQNSDCRSMGCDAVSHTCAVTQCTDHKQDGAETDVDCGGGGCRACLVGQKCLVNFDCQGGHVCSASHVCM